MCQLLDLWMVICWEAGYFWQVWNLEQSLRLETVSSSSKKSRPLAQPCASGVPGFGLTFSSFLKYPLGPGTTANVSAPWMGSSQGDRSTVQQGLSFSRFSEIGLPEWCWQADYGWLRLFIETEIGKKKKKFAQVSNAQGVALAGNTNLEIVCHEKSWN